MAVRHAQADEVIDVGPLGASLGGAKTTALVKTEGLELIRLALAEGKSIPPHTAPGEITLQCLEGRIAVSTEGRTVELAAGQLLCLPPGVRHAVRAIEDSSALLTILLPSLAKLDMVQEASEESFPASDPPARSPVTSS